MVKITTSLSVLPFIITLVAGQAVTTTLPEKADLLLPVSYRLIFGFYFDLEAESFAYSLLETMEFKLPKKVDTIVLECTVVWVTPIWLIYNNRYLSINMFRESPYLILHLKNNSPFTPGLYKFRVKINSGMTLGTGILVFPHMDDVTKVKYGVRSN